MVFASLSHILSRLTSHYIKVQSSRSHQQELAKTTECSILRNLLHANQTVLNFSYMNRILRRLLFEDMFSELKGMPRWYLAQYLDGQDLYRFVCLSKDVRNVMFSMGPHQTLCLAHLKNHLSKQNYPSDLLFSEALTL